MYKVTYNIKNNYDEFSAGLISKTGGSDFVNVKIYTDEICVYDINLTSSSDYQDISFNVRNSNELTFVMTLPYSKGYDTRELIVNNAYLTSEGTYNCNACLNPTVAPTTKATFSTEKTTTKVKPTASTNATSKVSSPDTAGKTGTGVKNNTSSGGFIKTGDTSIIAIIILLLASLSAGAFALYKRKIK